MDQQAIASKSTAQKRTVVAQARVDRLQDSIETDKKAVKALCAVGHNKQKQLEQVQNMLNEAWTENRRFTAKHPKTAVDFANIKATSAKITSYQSIINSLHRELGSYYNKYVEKEVRFFFP